jgi:hypothetical protein
MADVPPPEPPLDPLVLAENKLLECSADAKALVLSAEAVRQQAKTLTEELTLAIRNLNVPLPPAGER